MIVDIQEKRLGIEPLAQAMLLQTPTPGCIIMAGWTVERWDILSSELSSGNPYSLAGKWKCIIEQNLEKYAANVQWIFYGSCESWYHQIHLHHRGVDSCGADNWQAGRMHGQPSQYSTLVSSVMRPAQSVFTYKRTKAPSVKRSIYCSTSQKFIMIW